MILEPDLLPWHAENWAHFTDALSANRLAHGLILRGPAGVGKRRFARAMAATLFCDKRSDPPCGQCHGCNLFSSRNHPDFFELGPEGDSSQIRVAQLRELITGLSLASQMGGYKLVLIDPADAMNVNAQNSLLKTLEEPAGRTLLILVAARPSMLTATVRSRCQELRFACPPQAESLAWLQGRDSDTNWLPVLDLAAGAPLRALQLQEQGITDLSEVLANDLAALMAGRIDPINVAQSWCGDTELMLRLRWLQKQVYGLIRWQLGGSPELVHRLLHKSLQKRGSDTSVKSSFRYLDAVEKGIAMADRSVNQSLNILPLVAAWADGPRFEPITRASL